MGDFGKLAKGFWGDLSSGVKKIPGQIDHQASLVGLAGVKQANKVGASTNSGLYVGSMLSKGVKYGTYGAAGAATVGAAVGIVDRDKTMVGSAATGALSGAGLGAVAGAGVGAATVAAAIAKSVR
jgi:hypothetical protein